MGIGQGRGPHQVEIVRRRVVFGIARIRRAGQAPHGQVVARRAVLPLVVAVRREVRDRKRSRLVVQHVRNGAVDFGVAAPAALVVQGPGVADAGEHQSVLDPSHRRVVLRQPRDGADGAGNEQEAVCVPPPPALDLTREERCDRHSREIVVAE